MTQGEALEDTAIVIVTYNSAREIGACLEAALATGAEILVVDNASTDETARVVKRYSVRLLANAENRGFAGAVNQGVRETSAPFLLLVNPDAVILRGAAQLREVCGHAGVGATAGVLVDESGAPQRGFTVRRLPTPLALSFEILGVNRLFPRNPVNWRFRCFDLGLHSTVPIEVEQPAGAFFLFRRESWRELGGFDEGFHPLWFEDVDFCARLRQRGQAILLVPEAAASHTGAHSILNMALKIRQNYWYGNLLRYAAKHFSPPGRKLVCASVFLGAALRLIGDVLSRRTTGDWMEVARMAVRTFSAGPLDTGAPVYR